MEISRQARNDKASCPAHAGHLFGAEGPDDGFLEGLAGAEDRRREVGLVGGVGGVLALDGDGIVIPVDMAGLAGRAALEPVAGVDLDGGSSTGIRRLTPSKKRTSRKKP